MTTPVNDAIDESIAVGGETSFTYTFQVNTVISPALHPITVETRLGLVLTTLVEGVDFTVTGAGNPLGGTIVLDVGVFPAGAIAGVTWTRKRDNPVNRVTDFQIAGDFFALEVNDQLDYITQLLQDQKRDADSNFANSIRLAVGSLFSLGPMDDPITGNFLRAKSGGFEWVTLVGTGVASAVDESDTNSTKDKLLSNFLALQWERARNQSSGVVRVIARTQSDLFDGIPADWIVYKEDGSELDTTGTTTSGLQEAIDYMYAGGYNLEVIGGGVKPLIPAGPHGGLLGTDPFTTTNGSNIVSVAHVAHGLSTDDGVEYQSLSGAINGIPASEFSAFLKITVVDANNYTITTATNATSSGSAGGSAVTFQHKGIAVSVITTTTTIKWPPMQNKRILFNNIIISGSLPAGEYLMEFDSCMMVQLDAPGSIFVVENSDAGGVVKFAPTLDLPHDFEGPITTATRFNFHSLGSPSLASATVLFDTTNAPIIGQFFSFVELAAVATGAFGIDIVGHATRSFQRNHITAADIHDYTDTCVRIGTSSTGANNIRGNHFNLGMNPANTAKGLEVWARDNDIHAQISDDDDLSGDWVHWETSARKNNLYLSGTSALGFEPKITDGSVARDNALYTAGRIAASVHLNTVDQTGVVTATWTKVNFDTQDYDMGSAWHDINDRWEPGYLGLAHVDAAVGWVATTAGAPLEIALYRNGTLIHQSPALVTHDTTANQGPKLSVDFEILTATDYFEIFVRQGTGVNQDIEGNPTISWATFSRKN